MCSTLSFDGAGLVGFLSYPQGLLFGRSRLHCFPSLANTAVSREHGGGINNTTKRATVRNKTRGDLPINIRLLPGCLTDDAWATRQLPPRCVLGRGGKRLATKATSQLPPPARRGEG